MFQSKLKKQKVKRGPSLLHRFEVLSNLFAGIKIDTEKSFEGHTIDEF